MIKIRVRSLGQDVPLTNEIVTGESVMDATRRVLKGTPFEADPSAGFMALVNGHKIEKENWEKVKLKSDDVVLIAPELKGDSNTLRTAALIGVMLAAVAIAGPAGLALAPGSVAYAATLAGISVVGGLAVNALIPPEQPSVDTTSPTKESQTYAVSGQSNKTAKLGSVPKVYGNHRFFPNVAANPYTVWEADSNGKLVQYLYCIYDFGFGPAYIDELRIGDTAIGNFQDCEYRFVDFNRPDVAEGPWDEALNKSLIYYKGDVTETTVNVNFIKNQSDTPPPTVTDYQATRSTPENTEQRPMEITVSLIASGGLVGYSSSAQKSNRTVTFAIEFAKQGTEDWKAYNDYNFVSDFRSVGGRTVYTDSPINGVYYDSLPLIRQTTRRIVTFNAGGNYLRNYDNHGLPIGSTYIDLLKDDNITTNSAIRFAGETIGTVDTVEVISPTVNRYHFKNPTEKIFEIATRRRFTSINYLGSGTVTSYGDWEALKEVKRGVSANTKAAMVGSGTDPVYATFKWTPIEAAQYQVRITRLTSSSSFTYTLSDTVTWSSLQTRFDADPITTDKRHVFLEMRVKATNQLNGTIGNLSATVQSVLDTWDGTQWVKAPTSNPAWVYVDLLTGEINKRAIDKSRLDIDSIYEWAQYCDTIPDSEDVNLPYTMPRFTTNFAFDYASTLQQLVAQVSAAANASLNIIDGKYGVLLDRKKTVPVQVFTQRNSSNFQSSRSYPKKTHALEIQYIDPNLNWDLNTTRVYANGFDENNTTEVEEVTSFACTNVEQAWRLGRYLLAQSILRQENISIDVDFEYLVCTRGDYVQLVQDAMLAGGHPARVKSVAGQVVTLDDAIDNISVAAWGYVFRNAIGEIVSGTAIPAGDARQWELDALVMPEPDDLLVIGELTKVTLHCVVKAIDPKDDLGATLTLVEKADGVHDVEGRGDLPDYDPQISQVRPSDSAPPGSVNNLEVTDNAYYCTDAGYQHYVVLDWDGPTNSTYANFEIYVDFGFGFNYVTSTKESLYTYLVDADNLDREHTFKVIAVTTNGLKQQLIEASSVAATPISKMAPPSSVTYLSTNVTNEVLQLNWPKIEDCDLREYFIRYSPLTSGGDWTASVPLARADRNTTSTSVQARTGTYFIKAVDFNGNESSVAATAITTIPNLFGLNVITSISDTPAFLGSKERVVKLGSSLILANETQGSLDQQAYYADGYYYYRAIVDLGEIYTSRVQANIQAEGYTENDIVGNWNPVGAVSALATASVSDWDVETQYRVSNTRNVMEDWVLLQDIDPLNEGVDAFFSEWRPFIMGDITGRVIQFRLKLISNTPNVTPRVYDGTIKIDMPDRIDSFDNFTIPSTPGGTYFPFTPPFKGPGAFPNIQVSIENAQSGDYWVLSDRTLEGFRIELFDSTDTQVSRTVDIAVKGYGAKNTTII